VLLQPAPAAAAVTAAPVQHEQKTSLPPRVQLIVYLMEGEAAYIQQLSLLNSLFIQPISTLSSLGRLPNTLAC